MSDSYIENQSFNEHLRSMVEPPPPSTGAFDQLRKRGITPKGTRSSTGRYFAAPMSPPPLPLTREQHRKRQALRAVPVSITRNTADWLHDTDVVNREEKRAAVAVAKKHRCEEVREKDENGKTRIAWRHGATCPKWKPAAEAIDSPGEPTITKAEQAALIERLCVEAEPCGIPTAYVAEAAP